MKIHLPINIQQKLIQTLQEARNYEIGGVLMGEHIAEAEFRIVDLTIQEQFGSVTFFTRLVTDIVKPLKRFFKRTGHNYRKFNYLGEWHSHPSFSPVPSQKDIQSMQEIILDPDTGANFVILLIVKLKGTQEIEGTVTTFLRDGKFFKCQLITEKII